MLSQNDIIKFLKDNRYDLIREYNLSKIGLFGSFARGEQNEKSDIDILVEFLPETQNIYEKKNSLKELLKKKFSRDVGLCREKYIKSYARTYLENEVIYV
ncbi:MAG: nucleotidyltransferase domain-containing protein [Desulfamplus sp.]|nr:nucleotidyltransferase domain-containing protein [Desulfamplus sp.]